MLNTDTLADTLQPFAVFTTPFLDSLTTLNDVSDDIIPIIKQSSSSSSSPTPSSPNSVSSSRSRSSVSSAASATSAISNTSATSATSVSTTATSITSASSIKKKTPPEKRRVRTGCLTCRSKHKKCDEIKPICKFCHSKGLNCIWPSNGATKPNQLSDSIKKLISNSNQPCSNNSPTPNYLHLNSNLPSLLSIITSLQNGDYTSNLNSFIFFNDKSLDIQLNESYPTSLTTMLFNYFLSDPSSILQLNNSTQLIKLSQFDVLNNNSNFLHYAILAFSSKVLQQFDPNYNGDYSIEFYNLAVNKLSINLKDQINDIINGNINNKESIWWSIILLISFELLSVNPNSYWDRFNDLLNFFDVTQTFNDDNLLSIKMFLKSFLLPWSINQKLPLTSSITHTNIELYIQKICLDFNDDSLLQTYQTFFIKDQSDNHWIDLWNEIQIHHFNIRLNDHKYFQSDSIILDSGESLNDALLYHTSCYNLLKQKPELVNLIFQNESDFGSIIAFQESQSQQSKQSSSHTQLILNHHHTQLIKIINSNMLVKSDKSIYNIFNVWFACYSLSKDNSNSSTSSTNTVIDEKLVQINDCLRKIENWSHLDPFRWLIQEIGF